MRIFKRNLVLSRKTWMWLVLSVHARLDEYAMCFNGAMLCMLGLLGVVKYGWALKVNYHDNWFLRIYSI